MIGALTRFALGAALFAPVEACSPGSGQGTHQPSSLQPSGQSSHLGVGLRRLTNREFRKAAGVLLGLDLGPEFESALPPDVRQDDGYARNVAQTMSAALAVKLEQVIPDLARRALSSVGSDFRCAPPASQDCVRSWVERKAHAAWRRPVAAHEISQLLEVYRNGETTVGGDGRGPTTEGAAAVLTALLLSPDLWYVRELGEPKTSGPVVNLTAYEIADQVSLVIRGTVADEALLSDARAGALADGNARLGHARRLLALSDTRDHYREFVTSWLEIDELVQTSKSAAVFEQFETFKPRMFSETQRFVDAVFMHEGASINRLLGAGFASVDPEMAVFYGLDAYGTRVQSAHVGRFGVLQQASFLATHSQTDTTSPVLRGDFVLRKVLCHRLPRPSELDIEVVMPRPRRDMTRREQFALHGADPRCADCHDQIDGFGLVFEEFDAAGRRRASELDKAVRTDGKVRYREEDVAFSNSHDLVRWLQSKPETSECFARQLFRFVTGRVDAGAEDAFVALRGEIDGELRDNVLEHLLAYVGSEEFVVRRRQ